MRAMTIFDSIALGVIQGLTEFLPISSDGHLVVFERLLNTNLPDDQALYFDLMLHAGSLIAIILLYRDVWIRLIRSLFDRTDRTSHRLIYTLIIATIPGVIAGLVFEDAVASSLRSVSIAGVGFIVTAIVLIIGEWIGRSRTSNMNYPSFLGGSMIGIAQAIALLPGVSRSGLTISTGRVVGLNRKNAVDFSFLMSAPIIGGAVSLAATSIVRGSASLPSASITLSGFITSFIVSMGAILFLRYFVKNYSLAWFAVYLVPLGIICLMI